MNRPKSDLESPTKVQFRFLQVCVHAEADERITIGLVHFDGQNIRYAFRPERSPKAVEDLIYSVEHYKSVLDECIKSLPIGFSLETYSGLPHGDMGFLTWHPVKMSYTMNPESHFHQLAKTLELEDRCK